MVVNKDQASIFWCSWCLNFCFLQVQGWPSFTQGTHGAVRVSVTKTFQAFLRTTTTTTTGGSYSEEKRLWWWKKVLITVSIFGHFVGVTEGKESDVRFNTVLQSYKHPPTPPIISIYVIIIIINTVKKTFQKQHWVVRISLYIWCVLNCIF